MQTVQMTSYYLVIMQLMWYWSKWHRGQELINKWWCHEDVTAEWVRDMLSNAETGGLSLPPLHRDNMIMYGPLITPMWAVYYGYHTVAYNDDILI